MPYKGKPVKDAGEIRAVLCETYTRRIALWADTELLCLQQMVRLLTVVLQRVNYHVPQLSCHLTLTFMLLLL
jgi:hypothetical protein